MNRLDDSEFINSKDKSGMLKLISSFPDLLLEGLGYARKFQVEQSDLPSNVLILGYGGSAISGDILRNWLFKKIAVPVEICRDLELPGYINKKTLVICVSYSGETQETLRLLGETINTESKIAAVTSGGTMGKLCERHRIPMVKLRAGLQPRAALPLLFPALTQILSAFNVIEEMHSEIKETAEELRIHAQKLSPSASLNINPSKKLAVELLDSVPSIYSLERMSSVARRMKDQLNENSKILAKFDLIPESCHNEIEGTLGNQISGQSHLKFPLIFIRDERESPDEKIRMETFQKRFRTIGFGPIHEIRTNANTNLSRILLPINFGDFVSAYLAIARGFDPTPVYFIDEFKKIIEVETGTKEDVVKRFLS